jgi:5-amino-6-(5-phosphoribosylamino)uracil reductase
VLELHQLLPEAAEVEVGDLVGDAIERTTPPDERPHVIVNFVVSADGHATVDGRSSALGDEGDAAIFHTLREHVDAILAGTGTLRTERYGRMLGKAERRERRTARGQSPEPLAVVITRSGTIPTDIPLFAEPEANVVVFAPSGTEVADTPAQVTVVALDPEEHTLTTALRRLRSDFGVKRLLCEGGPTLFGSLLHEQLVDELFLTLAPKLVGGGYGPAVTAGPPLPEPRPLQPVWLLEHGDSLYLRYAVG